MEIEHLDHLVLTVRDIDRRIAFYRDVLGMREVRFAEGRRALSFGTQKLNLHSEDAPLAPHAARPTLGSADLCLITRTPIGTVITRLQELGVEVEAGPVPRTGALGPIESVYFRDPDGNLIEVANYRSIRLARSCANMIEADFLLHRGRFHRSLATTASAFLSTG